MLIHRSSCVHNYATTDEVFTVERIVTVFGHKDARWFLVKWQGYADPEWEREVRTPAYARQVSRCDQIVLGDIGTTVHT